MNEASQTPSGFAPSKPNFGQQAARASWIAPLIVFGLGICTFQNRQTDHTAGLVIGIANLLIMLTGLSLGIVALAGMKKWGRRGVLFPALAGFGIYLCLFLVVLAILVPALGRAKQTARKIQDNNAEQQGREAFMEDGWLGVLRHQGAVVTIATMNDRNAFASEMRSNLATPVSLAILSVDNTRGMTIDLDTKSASITFLDASSIIAPDTITILQSAKAERAAALKMFSPPFRVPAGTQLNGKLLFMPPGTDYRQIASVSVTIDGQNYLVPGRFYTAVEKAQLLRQAAAMQR